jgi:LPS sulfotransferase NodH
MPARSYLVCATQRSGSTLMCNLLQDTGVAGVPLEFFEARAKTGRPPHPGDYLEGLPRTGIGIRDDEHPAQAPEYSSLQGLRSYREHLERSFARGITANGVFGAKLMFNQLPELHTLATELPEYAGLELDELLRALFHDPLYVWVRREDTVRQAVSMWKAIQTRSWSKDEAAHRPDPQYSFAALDHLVERFDAEDVGWYRYFAAHRIEPVLVTYERDLEERPRDTVLRVLDGIGVVAPENWHPPQPTASRQADELSEEWVRAYHRDRVARDEPATGSPVGASPA